MINSPIFRGSILGLVLLGSTVTVAAGSDERSRPDGRFYIAPALTYDFMDQDSALDDDAGYRFSAGIPLLHYFNLEVNTFKTELDAKRNQPVTGGFARNAGSVEGVGANLLFFPARYHSPFFLVLAASQGDFESDAGADDSANIWEAGFGYIHPLTRHGGLSLRAEYRFRNTSVDDQANGDYELHDHVVSLGLQVPIGRRKSDQLSRPSDWRNPEPPANYVAAAAPVDGDDDRDGVVNSVDQCLNTPFGAAVLATGCSLKTDIALELKGVNFAFDSGTLLPESFPILDQAAYVLRQSPGVRVMVAGHTDSKGGAEYNENLSARRAESVRRYLIRKGIAPDRLVAKGYGESRPLVSNYKRDGSDDPVGRARNRRVEFWVIR